MREGCWTRCCPLLPAGVREDGDALYTIAGAAPDRAVLEAARCGRALDGWSVEEVPADWRVRRALEGGGGVVVAGRVAIRSPWDSPPADGRHRRRGRAARRRVRVRLAPDHADVPGAAARRWRSAAASADLGCGVGTLAIAAAKLGWGPVVAVDRVPVAIEVARENVERNGVGVACAVADLAVDAVPLAPLLLVNAPPPVHARVVASR